MSLKALHCVVIAQHAPTLDDRSEFLAFAESWYRLAIEIDISNRLIAFIGGLPASKAMENSEAEEIKSSIRSLKQPQQRFHFSFYRSIPRTSTRPANAS